MRTAEYPAPDRILLHLSDTHLRSGGSRLFDSVDAEAQLVKALEAIEASGGYQPLDRDRVVSPALRAYAMMATSADTGAVRDIDGVERLVNAARLIDSDRIGS